MKFNLSAYIAVFLVIIFTSLVTLTWINGKHDYDGALERAYLSTQHQSETFAEHAARSFQAVDLILLRVTEQLERDIAGTPRTSGQVQQYLQNLVDTAPQIRGLVVAGADGVETAANDGGGVGTVNVSDRDYFKAHQADPKLGLLVDKPLRGRVTGRWFLSISRRFNNPDGTFAGVVVAVVSQDYFNQFYQTAEDTKHLSTALVNADGLVFSFSSGFAPKGADVSGMSLVKEPLFAALKDATSDKAFQGKVFSTDEDRIISYTRVKSFPVIIVSTIPHTRALAEIQGHMITILTVFALTSVLLIGMFIVTIQHIREREKIEGKLNHMAHHDQLTNLPNRRQGLEYLSRAVATGRRHVTMAGVLFIDLDGFKMVNDTLGHEAGDLTLIEISRRFKNCVRETDTVARLGGDEYLVVLSDMTDQNAATMVAEKLLEAAREPVELCDKFVTLGASIGIAVYPHNGDSPDVLIKNADDAMYQAKLSGKNSYRFAL